MTSSEKAWRWFVVNMLSCIDGNTAYALHFKLEVCTILVVFLVSSTACLLNLIDCMLDVPEDK